MRSLPDLGDDVLEHLPVLAALDGVEVGTDQFDVVLLERTPIMQGHSGVQRSLPTEGGEYRVDRMTGVALGLDDLLDVLGRDRLDVGGVGELRIGHDGRRVGVDQAHAQALGLEDAARLGARVVELAGLSDDDRAGADHQDVIDVVAARH